MACARGKAAPTQTTRYRLFAESAGRCQNPTCLMPLFADTGTETVHIAEAAHIVAAKPSGARGDKQMTPEELGESSNLILLCANCHTIIDKAEQDFPVYLLKLWKADHLEKIDFALGVGRLESRSSVRARLDVYQYQNRAIFARYGPMSDERFNPDSDSPIQWHHHIRETILPNNRAILRLADSNARLLTPTERQVVENFRIHVQDFERRHLSDVLSGSAARYPVEMDLLYSEDGAV